MLSFVWTAGVDADLEQDDGHQHRSGDDPRADRADRSGHGWTGS